MHALNILLRLLILLTLCWPLAVRGEEMAASPASAAATAPPETEAHVLRVYNRPITTFSSPFAGYSPQDRATAAALRISRLLEQDPQAAISQSPSAEGMEIRIGGKIAFYLRHGDIDTLGGETLAQRSADARKALEAVREDRLALADPRELLKAAAIIAIATVLLVLILKVLRRVRRWVLVRSRRYIARPIASVTGRYTGTNARTLAHFFRHLVNLLVSVLGLFFLYSWLSLVLHEIPYTRAWSEQLNQAVLGFLESSLLAVLGAVPDLLIAGFILLIARYVTRFIHYLFARVERGELQLGLFDRDTAATTRRLLAFSVWLFAFAMIYPYLPGADTEAFKGLSVMVGLMVSLGASSIVGQFASGMIIIYSRALRVGEYVQIGDVEGTVMHIGLFATKIHTNLREEISIPNSGLVGQNVKNFSRLASGGGVISTVEVTIGYDAPWRQVEAMLLEAAGKSRGVRRDPAPVVYQTGLSDWYVVYQLRVAVDEPRRKFEILNELHGQIQDTFNHYGVQIMSPHYLGDPASEKLVPEQNWYAAPARQDGKPIAASPPKP
ncbi:mechanosensitive ion channel family protein [Chitinilyticum litopenaei]|uniref:mechanosensitive ion channel family protein n=1 Tax=Chitinilyticum litopenaei TaxID=1121276 RepID=UPI000402C5EF|nr:mechanosensitive ion channel family protein [Chitinilyticum litopenaei]